MMNMNVSDMMPATGLMIVLGGMICPVLIDSGATTSWWIQNWLTSWH